jgi:hypothetical protein
MGSQMTVTVRLDTPLLLSTNGVMLFQLGPIALLNCGQGY